MKVDLITETNSDLMVVNAARCSFDKESRLTHEAPEVSDNCTRTDCKHMFMKETDVKLINYLAQHQHWTPFGHPQEVFDICGMRWSEIASFLLKANLSGFEWTEPWNLHSSDTTSADSWRVRGSFYAWITNLQWLPENVYRFIYLFLEKKYPVSFGAFKKGLTAKVYERIKVFNLTEPVEDELRTYTLRFHVPIFVKRQLETHRRNFVMTDIEDFVQNEVSRRYVDSEPEIYRPETWRLQSENKKQGSDMEKALYVHDAMLSHSDYVHSTEMSLTYYFVLNRRNIAREQTRMVLPLSTYTTFWWTGSVKSWKRLLALRLAEDAQSETRDVAQLCAEALPAFL